MAATTTPLQLSVAARGDEVLVSLIPEAGTTRTPIDVCCVLDISGSMGDEAPAPATAGGADRERHGFSVLDLVKHATSTVVHVLDETARLSIVSFSSNGKVELPLTKMDSAGQALADESLKKLHPTGSTNLFDGLQVGLRTLEKSRGEGRLGAVLLLTDGMPDRAERNWIQKYNKQNPLEGITVSTFGFGYSLNSNLLNEVAVEGSGVYAFIPDSSMVGTIFVNTISYLLSICAVGTTLELTPLEGAEFADSSACRTLPGCSDAQLSKGKATVHLGTIQKGQTRDVILRLKKAPTGDKPYLSVVAVARPALAPRAPLTLKAEGCLVGQQPQQEQEVAVQAARLAFVACMWEVMQTAKVDQALALAKKLAGEISAGPAAREKRVAALLQDIQGQVFEALTSDQPWRKWGIHFLPSLAQAHLLQVCNNFKDPGVQVYGGSVFNSVRDQADDIFVKLPPPPPSCTSSYYGGGGGGAAAVAAAPASMSSYYNACGGCFAASCRVAMADGTLRAIEKVRAGDVLSTGAEVKCLVRIECPTGRNSMCELPGGLIATPWHPVSLDGGSSWSFPCELATPRLCVCPAVFNLVLCSGHVAVIEGISCVTLGHGFVGDKREHVYWGTAAVLDDLARFPGWETGFVLFGNCSWERSPVSGLVCGIKVFA